jgi:hypothetical protein
VIPPLVITLPPEAAALIGRAQAWPRALTRGLIVALNRENEITVGHIARTRATGAGPFPVSEGKLGVVTNRYRSSLRRSAAVVVGSSIIGAIGSNVAYAGAHEFGSERTVSVPEHTRRIFQTFTTRAGAVFNPKTGKITKAKARTVEFQSGSVRVRAHQMRQHIPARAPIQRGIADRLPAYSPALGAAIMAAFQAPVNA